MLLANIQLLLMNDNFVRAKVEPINPHNLYRLIHKKLAECRHL